MSNFVNSIDVYSPAISFTISRNDNVDLSDYQMFWSGTTKVDGTNTDGSKIFSAYGPPAYVVPAGVLIKFTPNFSSIPSNNSIIQYKWSFGDGIENLIQSFSGTPSSILHTYNSGLAPITGTVTCLTATLTAIDQYQRHVRAYKQIYLKST